MLEDTVKQVVTWLLTQGWVGISYMILGGVIVAVWRDRRECLETNKVLTKVIADLQEKRVEDAREDTKTQLEVTKGNTAAIQSLTEIVRSRR